MTRQIRRMLLAGCCLCSSILLVGCASFYHATKADEDACLSISLIISPYVKITPGDTNLVLGYLRGVDSPVLKAAGVKLRNAQKAGDENEQVIILAELPSTCAGVTQTPQLP